MNNSHNPHQPSGKEPASWLDILNGGRTGFYQRCASCDWVGTGMRMMVYTCPACGGETDPEVALKEGGLMIWIKNKEFYLTTPWIYESIRIEAADIPDVITLFEHWKNHPNTKY